MFIVSELFSISGKLLIEKYTVTPKVLILLWNQWDGVKAVLIIPLGVLSVYSASKLPL